jgi:hypothetical protein
MSFCYIVRYSRAHTCMRSAFLTDKIDLYPQCVFSCDCSSSPASAAFGLDSVVVRGKNRFERFLLFTLLMPEHEWISPRPLKHSFCSFLNSPHTQYKCCNPACLCVRIQPKRERHSIWKIRSILDTISGCNCQNFQPFTQSFQFCE